MGFLKGVLPQRGGSGRNLTGKFGEKMMSRECLQRFRFSPTFGASFRSKFSALRLETTSMVHCYRSMPLRFRIEQLIKINMR